MATNKKFKDFDIESFIQKNKVEKKNYIISESQKIKKIPKDIIKDLHQAYRYKETIDSFIVNYIKKIKNNNPENSNIEISNEINKFKKNYIKNILPKRINQKIVNVYSLSGADSFAKIQLVLRSFSTSMGSLWEKIAICGQNSISTENEFGLKITGTDLISLINDKPTYIQIKTMEDTLTGSQGPRSANELGIHNHSFFAAAFYTGRTWHFKSDKIKKYRGKEFWSKIGLDYNHILDEVKKMVKEVENKYYELTKIKN
jgi:hypothetical protein